MTYDDLLDEASNSNIYVVEKKFKSKAKGLCKGNHIGIRSDLLTAEKVCTLAEELGHYYTGCGDIIEQNTIAEIKQEHKARVWAYNKLISPEEIRFAYLDGYTEIYDIADYLGVSEEFLNDCMDYYMRVHEAEWIIKFCKQ